MTVIGEAEIDVGADTSRFAREVRDGILSSGPLLAKTMAGAVAAGMVGLGAQAVVGGVVAATAALAPLTGALAAVPALAAAGGAATGTLALGLQGVADAIKAIGDPKKFADAIATISPEARDTALALQEIRPALDDLQLGVQDQLFRDLADTLTSTADAVLPRLRSGLEPIADQFNAAAQNAASFVREGRTLDALDGILASTAESLREVAGRGLTGVLEGTRGLAVAGTPYVERFGDAVADMGERFGDAIAAAAEDGRITGWIDGAIVTAEQLGSVLGNVGGIVAEILRAGQGAGGGLLANLDTALEGVNDFLDSPAGQGALASFFRGTADAAAVVGPILGSAFGVIGEIAEVLGGFVEGVGPGLSTFLDGLAGGVGQLVPVAEPLGAALGDILTTLTPLLPELGEFAALLAVALTETIPLAIPVIEELVVVLDKLIPSFEQLNISMDLGGGIVAAVAEEYAQLARVATASFGLILSAAAASFGWAGDLGEKLKASEKAFDIMASHAIAQLDAIAIVGYAAGERVGFNFTAGMRRGLASAAAELNEITDEKSLMRNVEKRTEDIARSTREATKKVTTPLADFTRGVTAQTAKVSTVAADLARAVQKNLQDQATSIKGVISDLQQEFDTFETFRQQAVDTAKDFASITSIFTDSSRASATGFITGLETRLKALQLYNLNIKSLTARGLAASVIEDITALGPDQGRAYAAALAAGNDSQIQRINELQRRAEAIAGTIGTSASQGVFGDEPARVRAQLDRLNAQLAEVNKQLKQQPALIAKATEQARKNAAVATKSTTRTAVA